MTCFPLHCYEEREILHKSEKGEKERSLAQRERERQRGKIQMGESTIWDYVWVLG